MAHTVSASQRTATQQQIGPVLPALLAASTLDEFSESAAPDKSHKSPTAATPLSPSDDWYFGWGKGDIGRGLDQFAVDPEESDALDAAAETAKNWERTLLQGEVGSIPMMGRSPTFVCQSRRAALRTLAPLLTQLDNGKLCGQDNCFAVLGARGVGKTRFIKSIAHVVELLARPTTCVIYVNLKSAGLLEPLHLLQSALRDARSGVDLPAELAGPDARMSHLLHFMRDHERRALLLVDEAEQLYVSAAPDHKRVWQQLHSIGEYDGKRPIMAVLTGSSAALRALLFAIPGWGALDAYQAYRVFSSLNDRKYLPIMLRPIVAVDDVRRAILCIASDIPECVRPLQRESALAAPQLCSESAASESAVGGAGALAAVGPAHRAVAAGTGFAASSEPVGGNLLADGYSVTDEFVTWVCARCRGLASWIHSTLKNPSSRTEKLYHFDRLLGGSPAWREHMLRRLLHAWMASTRDAALEAAVIDDRRICEFGMLLAADEPTAPWLELMDAGAAFVEPSAAGLTVQFLHPSDAGTLLLRFGKESGSPGCLSRAEQLSLLQPQLASADEINEHLVFESLAWKSSPEGGGLRVQGMIVTGVRTGTGHVSLSDEDGHMTAAELVDPRNHGVLAKEFPDMFGGDGSAYLSRMLSRLPKNVLMRVQVKLAGLHSSTCVNSPTAERWISKIVASSEEMVKLIAGTLDASEPVVACHVFWVAQKLNAPAQALLSDQSRVALLVHRDNMLEYWSPRVRQFVEERRLVQYGYVPAAVGGAGSA